MRQVLWIFALVVAPVSAQVPSSELWPRVGPDVFVDLTYPADALAARIEGAVVVRVTTDGSGRVIEAEALTGPAVLAPAVLDNVKQWTVTRGVRTTIIVYRFQINRGRCNDRRSLFRLVEPNLAVVSGCFSGDTQAVVNPTDQLQVDSKGERFVFPHLTSTITGVVVLELTLDSKGRVVEARPLTELPMLTQAVVAHSKTLRFEPTRRRRGIFVYEFAKDLINCADDPPPYFWRVTNDFWRISTCGQIGPHADDPTISVPAPNRL